MYQHTAVVGNVGRDAEMRFTPSGKAVTEFSVAENYGYGDNKKVQWWSVNAWNKLAEVCNEHVKKGMRVLVAGHAELQEWETDGQHRCKMVLVADKVVFLSSRGEAQSDAGDMLPPEDDIPF